MFKILFVFRRCEVGNSIYFIVLCFLGEKVVGIMIIEVNGIVGLGGVLVFRFLFFVCFLVLIINRFLLIIFFYFCLIFI